MIRFFLALLLLFSFSHPCYAAAVQAMQQKKAQEEALMQEQIVQQQIMQQQIVQQHIIQQKMADQAIVQQLEMGIPFQANIEIPAAARVPDEAIAQVADMSQILKSLETSSRVWPLIADPEPKIFIVSQYINFYKKQGVTIRKSPEFYAQGVDEMSHQTPGLLTRPLAEILQFMAIVEYDFDNGQNKDKMALQLLGEEGFRSNKERLARP